MKSKKTLIVGNAVFFTLDDGRSWLARALIVFITNQLEFPRILGDDSGPPSEPSVAPLQPMSAGKSSVTSSSALDGMLIAPDTTVATLNSMRSGRLIALELYRTPDNGLAWRGGRTRSAGRGRGGSDSRADDHTIAIGCPITTAPRAS